MNILVTGARGFIGTNLVNYLQACPSITVLSPTRAELPLIDSQAVSSYMQKYQPQAIIHLSANPLNKPNANDPNQILYDNILATHNLCYYAPSQCRFIFTSTISVYGATPLPVNENTACKPESIYGATKLACEHIIDTYTMQKQIKGISLRLCATVGPHLTHGILYDFMNKVQQEGDYLEVFGDSPGAFKPFIHIYDVIQAIVFMLNREYITYPVNIATTDLLSVKEIAEMLLYKRGIDKKIKWLGSKSIWKGDQNILQVDNSLMKNIGIDLYYQTSREAMYNTIG